MPTATSSSAESRSGSRGREATGNSRPKRPSSRVNRLMFLGVFLMLIAGFGTFLVLSFGRVAGVEFSPATFSTRSYSFFQIPLVQWQISPATRDDLSGDLKRYLKANSYLRTLPTQRWDVITVSQAGRESEGDAIILHRYLSAKDSDGERIWLEWTREHRAFAGSFWVAVQHAADLRAYELIPDLFRFASTQDSKLDAAAFAVRLMAHQQREYELLAIDLENAGNAEQAAELQRGIDELRSKMNDAVARTQRLEKQSEDSAEPRDDDADAAEIESVQDFSDTATP